MSRLDGYDALAGLGVTLMASGLWLLHPAAALIVLGLLLLLAAVVVLAVRQRGQGGRHRGVRIATAARL